MTTHYPQIIVADLGEVQYHGSMEILQMSQGQIESRIFAGAGPTETRSPLDYFTEEEICALPRHPEWDSFDMEFKDWWWETIGCILQYM